MTEHTAAPGGVPDRPPLSPPSPPRMAYLSNNLLPGSEPGLVFSVFTALGLRQAGADCLLVLPKRDPRPAPALLRELFDIPDDLPVRTFFLPRIGGGRRWFHLRAFLHLLRSDRAVLVTRDLRFLPWAILLRKLRSLRVYFEAHDFWTDPALRPGESSPGRRRQARLEQRWLPCTDGLVCVSEPQAQLYRRYYPTLPVVTAMTGTRPVRSQPRPHFTYTLGYLGSFTEGKYPLPLVFEALAPLVQPSVRLLCVGLRTETERVRLTAAAERLGVANRVELHPWCCGETLDRLEARMDVGVAVLSDTFLNRIASPLKVLEYLSMPVPVIATRLAGIEAVVEDGREGYLVDHSPQSWQAAIRRIYTDFAAYQAMARHCVARASSLAWVQRGRTILQALDR